ncbi:glycosyltransferase [Chloroflexota bacterium]
MTPTVTVLMSVYNELPCLEAALGSILEQTLDDFEFLIIDDGSRDGSRELLTEYAARDRRLRILENAGNRGLGFSLARGVEEAQAPWVARMDADDIAVTDRLKMQMDYVTEHSDVDIVGGWAIEMDDQGNLLEERRVPTSHEEIRRLIWTNPLLHPTVMFRRESIRRVGSYRADVGRQEDYELWFRCVKEGLHFANIPVPLLYIRFTEATLQRRNLRSQMSQMLVGWRGCWLVRASPIAYVGVAIPMLRGLVPPRFRPWIHRFLKAFDPRAKARDK